jgi:6-pyruvoyltetrahydropterin/6-carboxytetrahydropterin synthase
LSDELFFTAAAPFEAAREVPLLPEGHRARGLHGHSFLATVRLRRPEGWADFPGGEVAALRKRLSDVVAPLDYAHLNAQLEQPTDENLARWIRKRLDLAGIHSVGVQSTSAAGTDLDHNGQAHLWRRYAFEAAHQLPRVPPRHKCGRMHGHGFAVILHARQESVSNQFGAGYDQLDTLWAPCQEALDHACLNDIPGLENPTSELIARWIWEKLKPRLPALSWVTVYETATCGAHFDGRQYRIWKDLTLDSALQSKRAPAGDRRRGVHGHTYTLRLHLNAPLDPVMGWTMDFGEVKDAFSPLFLRLDHQPLHEVLGDSDTDAATLVRWLKEETVKLLPHLDRVDLYETRGCGAILSWGEAGPALPA